MKRANHDEEDDDATDGTTDDATDGAADGLTAATIEELTRALTSALRASGVEVNGDGVIVEKKNKGGRPRKMAVVRMEKAMAMIADGASIKKTCVALKIKRASFYRWRREMWPNEYAKTAENAGDGADDEGRIGAVVDDHSNPSDNL